MTFQPIGQRSARVANFIAWIVAMLLILVVLTALAGCGSSAHARRPTAPDEPSKARVIDFVGVTGVAISIESGNYSASVLSSSESRYIRTRECVAKVTNDPEYLLIPGPLMKLVAAPFWVDGAIRYGWTSFVDGQVTMAELSLHNTTHEFVHYLLWKRGVVDNVANAQHASEAFDLCTPYK